DRSEVVQETGGSAPANGNRAASGGFRGTAAAPPNPADGNSNALDALKAWWTNRHRNRSQRPGMWVVYFSFAALPVFGFGQWLIPEANADLRSSSFRLLYVYLGSALGLLLTTSFLGLRRYLRQRNVEMPA